MKEKQSDKELEQKIQEHLRTKTALYESQEKYEILNEIEDGYIETDLDIKLYFVNNSFCKLVGYSPKELLKLDLINFTEDKALLKSIYKPTKAFAKPVSRLESSITW